MANGYRTRIRAGKMAGNRMKRSVNRRVRRRGISGNGPRGIGNIRSGRAGKKPGTFKTHVAPTSWGTNWGYYSQFTTGYSTPPPAGQKSLWNSDDHVYGKKQGGGGNPGGRR